MNEIIEKITFLVIGCLFTSLFFAHFILKEQAKTCSIQFEKLSDYKYCMSLTPSKFYKKAKIEVQDLGQ